MSADHEGDDPEDEPQPVAVRSAWGQDPHALQRTGLCGRGPGGPSRVRVAPPARPMAARSRSKVRSGPSASRASNSGGPTRRPVTATRMGAWALPNLRFTPLAHGQRGGMEGVVGPAAGEVLVGLDGPRQNGVTARSSLAMALAHGLVVDGRGVEEDEVDHGRGLGEHGHPLLDHRGQGGEGRRVEASAGPRGHDGRRRRARAGTTLDERPGRHGPDVLTVDMGELDHVEEGRGMVHVLQANHSSTWPTSKISWPPGGLHPSRPR